MPQIDIVRDMYTRMKIKKRIEANRIIGTMGFRDHFSSHSGRHSWDLCGHPVYWWVLKAAANTKYLEKILLWTEVEQAWKDAREMSDKFVIWKRSIEECKEPMWKFVDDLKGLKSRVNTQENWLYRNEKIKELLGFEPTIRVSFQANQPLIRAESVTRLIEKYFEDDIAERAAMVAKIAFPTFHMRQPGYPEYLVPIFEFSYFGNRQERPEIYDVIGSSIQLYTDRLHSMSERMAFVEVGADEKSDIHDEEDLELAILKMRKRLEREKGG